VAPTTGKGWSSGGHVGGGWADGGQGLTTHGREGGGRHRAPSGGRRLALSGSPPLACKRASSSSKRWSTSGVWVGGGAVVGE
jgi:hypothetical protein